MQIGDRVPLHSLILLPLTYPPKEPRGILVLRFFRDDISADVIDALFFRADDDLIGCHVFTAPNIQSILTPRFLFVMVRGGVALHLGGWSCNNSGNPTFIDEEVQADVVYVHGEVLISRQYDIIEKDYATLSNDHVVVHAQCHGTGLCIPTEYGYNIVVPNDVYTGYHTYPPRVLSLDPTDILELFIRSEDGNTGIKR